MPSFKLKQRTGSPEAAGPGPGPFGKSLGDAGEM
jgi:hypothetical protein